nr:GNAT family N-acetyltransferase [Galbitalea soli]
MFGAGEALEAAVHAALAIDETTIVTSVLAILGGRAVGHAGIRRYDDAFEVRKVVVEPGARGLGLSKALMAELEVIAREHGVTRLLLQTGDLQREAIGLYERIGYHRVPVYGGYGAIPGAICYEKILR